MTFDIYVEGYRANGDSGDAHKIGTGEGATFKEACDDLARRDAEFQEYYDPTDLSHWGCGLYPTLEEAQKWEIAHRRE